MLVSILQHVSSRVSGFPLASPCLWGKLQNLSLLKVSNQVVMLFCVAGTALRDISRVCKRAESVLCDTHTHTHNTFASFPDDETQFSWQAQHFGDLHHHYFAWQAQHFRRAAFTIYTLDSTLYAPHPTLHTLHFPLHNPHFSLRTPHSTLYPSHLTLYTFHSTLHTLHSTLRTPRSTLYTPHSSLYTLHSTL